MKPHSDNCNCPFCREESKEDTRESLTAEIEELRKEIEAKQMAILKL